MTLIASCKGEHGEERGVGVGVGTELRLLMGSDPSALISRRHSPALNAGDDHADSSARLQSYIT